MNRLHRTRLAIIACLSLLYILLSIWNGSDAFKTLSFPQASLRCGFSALVGLLYLSIGGLVWLYACNRLVGWVLLGFAFATALTFAGETGAQLGDPSLTLITSVSSTVALAGLATLFLLFPRNALSLKRPWEHDEEGGPRARGPVLALRGYLCGLLSLGAALAVLTVTQTLGHWPHEGGLPVLVDSYGSLVLVGSLISIVLAYRSAPTLRERQQLRLLVVGCLFALTPFLVLTLLPLALHLGLAVDSLFSTTPLIVLPLALGYAILRYQLLFFDRYVRRVVAGLVGFLCMAVLSYAVITVSLLLQGATPARVGFVLLALAALGSLVWWAAEAATERLLFPEIRHYRRLLSQSGRFPPEAFDLSEVAGLIVAAALEVFEAPAACLLVLDEDTGCYRPYFPLETSKRAAPQLIGQVFTRIQPVCIAGKQTDLLDAQHAALIRLAREKRPLLLSELLRGEGAGLPRYRATTRGGEADPLLAPALAEGSMVGILVLGTRGDRQAYAGPDFEAIDLIFSRFGAVLENARSTARDSGIAALVMKLYTGMATALFDRQSTLEEVARSYARVAASATSALAEIWLAGEEEGEQVLRRILRIGSGPPPTNGDSLRVADLHEGGVARIFASWHRSAESLAAGEAHTAPPLERGVPFARLPLVCDERLIGVLALIYQRPHTFSEKEQQLLALYSLQCAASLHGAHTAHDLGAAHALEVELDHLRDQALLAALRALRLPLATIEGSVEMVRDFGARLPPSVRFELLARVQRVAAGQSLQVLTMIDALLPPSQQERPLLRRVPLEEAIRDVFAIRAAAIASRAVRTEIAPDLWVLADDLRLRQILLSLLDNALTSSPAGSDFEVTAVRGGEEVTVRLRHYGTDIPPEAQAGLFTPLAQGGPPRDGPQAGTGLALAVSKQLVEVMGGHLWLEKPDAGEAGSILAFTLPLAGRERSTVENATVPE